VGGTGVNVAVWVGSGVGVWLGGTSWGCVAAGLAVFVTVAADPMATCARVAVGAGAAGILQPVLSMPTISIAIMIGMHLPKRSIARPLYSVPLMPPDQSRRQLPPPEQGGESHRSPRPQQVCPAGRRDSLLST